MTGLMMPIESITRIEFNLPPAVGLLIRCFAENRIDRASVQINNTHPVTVAAPSQLFSAGTDGVLSLG